MQSPLLQFSLATLLGVVWGCAVFCGFVATDFGALLYVGLPLIWAGLRCGGWWRRFCSPERRVWQTTAQRAAIFALVGVGAGACFVACCGWPLDVRSWCFCVAGAAWSIVLTMDLAHRGHAWAGFAPLLIYPAAWVLCSHSPLYDLRGGRLGTFMHFSFIHAEPVLCAFVHDGPNTAVIERYLGPQPPEWHWRYTYNGILQFAHIPDDPITPRLLVFRPHLQHVAQMLPSDGARRQVLRSLTDPNNLPRPHQGLLLTCLWAWGFPPGYDAQRWWARHQDLFRSYDDPREAAQLVLGWTDTVRQIMPLDELCGAPPWYDELCAQWSAAYSAQRYRYRTKGGREFAEAYWELYLGKYKGRVATPANVVWWPKYVAQPPPP